jgi:site-specific recombinase XerD
MFDTAVSGVTTTDTRQALIKTVLDAMTSEHSKRAYQRHLTAFLTWHTAQGQPPLTKAVVQAYKSHLQANGAGAGSINQALCAIRKLVREAADNGAVDPIVANGVSAIKGVKSESLPAGRSISPGELSGLLAAGAADASPAGARDAAIIALLYSTGLRRAEAAALEVTDFDPESGELKILHAKGGKQRLAYVVNGAAAALADWLTVRGSEPGALFVQIRKGGHITGAGLTPQGVYHILQQRASRAGVTELTPHDFRRTFVGDLLDAGADLATVQKMAGHSDPATTSRYDRRPDAAKKRAAGLLHTPYFGRG